jgi:ribonucleoside-diphosphate reductase alpha chain
VTMGEAPPTRPRRELPARRETLRQRVRIAGCNLYLDCGFYPDTPQTVGEVFIVIQKTGDDLRALVDTTARLISVGLQHGVPLSRYVDLLAGTRFGPAGPVEGDPRIKFCSSPLDYVARHLGVHYLQREDLAHLPATEPVA